MEEELPQTVPTEPFTFLHPNAASSKSNFQSGSVLNRGTFGYPPEVSPQQPGHSEQTPMTLGKQDPVDPHHGYLTNPFTLSETELLQLSGGMLYSEASEASPVMRLRGGSITSPDIRSSPEPMGPLRGAGHVKGPVIRPISTFKEQTPDLSKRGDLISPISRNPQLPDNIQLKQAQSRILEGYRTLPAQKRLDIRAENLGNYIIQEEDSNPMSKNTSILDQRNFSGEDADDEISNNYRSLSRSPKMNTLPIIPQSLSKEMLIAELKAMLVETIKENAELKEKVKLESITSPEPSLKTEKRGKRINKRYPEPEKKVTKNPMQARERVSVGSPKSFSKFRVRQQSESIPSIHSLVDKSNLEMKVEQLQEDATDAEIETSRLVGLKQDLEKKLKEKDKKIEEIISKSQQKQESFEKMKAELEQKKRDLRSEQDKMKRIESARQQPRELAVMSSNSLRISGLSSIPNDSSISPGSKHASITSPGVLSRKSNVTDRVQKKKVDSEILALAQNYAGLSNNLQRELQAYKRNSSDREHRIQRLKLKEGMAQEEVHRQKMKIAQMKKQREAMKSELTETKTRLTEKEQKYRTLKKKVYQKLKEKNEQIVHLKEILRNYNYSQRSSNQVCQRCQYRYDEVASPLLSGALSPMEKLSDRVMPVERNYKNNVLSGRPASIIGGGGFEAALRGTADIENLSTNMPHNFSRLQESEIKEQPSFNYRTKSPYLATSHDRLSQRSVFQSNAHIQASQRLKDILDEAVFLTKLTSGECMASIQDKIDVSSPPQRLLNRSCLARTKDPYSSSKQGSVLHPGSKAQTELSRTLPHDRNIEVAMFDVRASGDSKNLSRDQQLSKLLRSNSSSSVHSYEEGRNEVREEITQLAEIKAHSQYSFNDSIDEMRRSVNSKYSERKAKAGPLLPPSSRNHHSSAQQLSKNHSVKS